MLLKYNAGVTQNSVPRMRSHSLYPDAIIIGVAKSGTRALLEFLSLHPDIVAAKEEIAFFSRPLLYSKGLGYYLTLLPKRNKTEQVLIEKSPQYFQSPSAPARMRRMRDDVKLILIVRDPVERMVSQYVHFDQKTGKTFEVLLHVHST